MKKSNPILVVSRSEEYSYKDPEITEEMVWDAMSESLPPDSRYLKHITRVKRHEGYITKINNFGEEDIYMYNTEFYVIVYYE